MSEVAGEHVPDMASLESEHREGEVVVEREHVMRWPNQP